MKTLYSAMYHDSHPFDVLVDNVVAVNTTNEMTNPDSILIVWGGSDIDPALYGHLRSRTTYPGGRRDVIEWALMRDAARKGIPIIGVCRGAQMLCALAGGFLLQDVRGHHGSHPIKTFNGETINVNSIHHQMMAGLEMIDHELIAWSEHNLSPSYIWQNDLTYTPPTGWVEPEFVIFPKIQGYAIQWHPEMMGHQSEANQFVLNLLKERICLETV